MRKNPVVTPAITVIVTVVFIAIATIVGNLIY